MTVEKARREVQEALARAAVPHPAREAVLMVSHSMGCSSSALFSHPERILTEEARAKLESMVQRRVSREPLQYILGRWEFYGRTLAVDRGVLIPRPETEILVEKAIERLSDDGSLFLDWGTGSGCIALTMLLERKNCRCCAVDRSPLALRSAWRNLKEYSLLSRVFLWHSRVPQDIPLGGETLSMIVSNPPYIPTVELPHLMEEVRKEPLVALDGGADGLHWCRELTALASRVLRPGGRLLLEIGGKEQADALSGTSFPGLVIEDVFPDLSGIPRVVAWIHV